MQLTLVPRRWATVTAVTVVATAGVFVSGCTADNLMSRVALPAAKHGAPAGRGHTAAVDRPAPQAARVPVTGRQRGYLDELAAAAVRPSSELSALSIGSYICQERAAGQDAKAMWDFVFPLVQRDVRRTGRVIDADAVTHTYIRIATERLC